MTPLKDEFILPNGSILSHRLGKSALSENLESKTHAPTETLIGLYRRWLISGAELIITGHIMVDSKVLGEPQNVVIEGRRDIDLLKKWVETMKGTETNIWP